MDLRAAIERLSNEFARAVVDAVMNLPLTALPSPPQAPQPTKKPKAPTQRRGRRTKHSPQPTSLRPLVDKLRSKREAMGLSQRQLAERLGIKQPHVANIERYHSKPSDALLARWRKVVGA